MALRLQVAARTDVGCVRSNNEDNFGYDARHGIYLVCDGMGGQAAGEVASELCVNTVLHFFRESGRNGKPAHPVPSLNSASERASLLASAIQAANQAVHAAAERNPAYAGMGTTVAAVLVAGEFLSIAHVGDSRIYRLRDGAIEQLTRDHSLVMEQVRLGLLTPAEARNSSMQNIITRALGSGPEVEVDVDDLMPRVGDVLVLCTDGLTRHVPDDAIAEAVTKNRNLNQACALLIEAARDAGGEDNITCILLRFQQHVWYKNLLRPSVSGENSQWQKSF